MAYEIETDVEMPPQRRYPWADMKVGNSFFLEGRSKKLIIPKWIRDQARFEQAYMRKDGAGSPMGMRVKRVS